MIGDGTEGRDRGTCACMAPVFRHKQAFVLWRPPSINHQFKGYHRNETLHQVWSSNVLGFHHPFVLKPHTVVGFLQNNCASTPNCIIAPTLDSESCIHCNQ